MRLPGNCKQSSAVRLLRRCCQSDSGPCQRPTNTREQLGDTQHFSNSGGQYQPRNCEGVAVINSTQTPAEAGRQTHFGMKLCFSYSDHAGHRPSCGLVGGSPQKLGCLQARDCPLNPALPLRSPWCVAEHRGSL